MRADLLAVSTHPDDEVLHFGALLHQSAQAGGTTVTVTLTRGETGRTLGICSREDLPAVRELELHRAAEALGTSCAEVHGLPDGDLELHEAAGVDLVLSALHRWRPRQVVTFPPNGMNGHPDHRATHRIALAALQRHSGAPEVLLATSSTPYTEPARPGFLAPELVEAARLAPTWKVPVGASLEAKLRAMGHYETQARSIAKTLRCYPGTLVTEEFHQLA
ncbi:PIG-L deacetylase family protein [Kitasatospora sp. NPDC006697]|uniref:PIG-L deacetylase family protein n=1 Tax=Kitasatospora sp. NPDC006697 TaxID=3364020 RepID=UPI0036AA7C07